VPALIEARKLWIKSESGNRRTRFIVAINGKIHAVRLETAERAKLVVTMTKTYRVLILGDRSVGKTSLVNAAKRFADGVPKGVLNRKPQEIIGKIVVNKMTVKNLDGDLIDLEIYDLNARLVRGISTRMTSLQRTLTRRVSHRKLTRNLQGSSFAKADYAKNAVVYDAFLLCYSVYDLESFVNIKQRWYFEISRLLTLEKPCIVLCGTQNDKILNVDPTNINSAVPTMHDSERRVSKIDGNRMATEIMASSYTECSALEVEVETNGEPSCVAVMQEIISAIDRSVERKQRYSSEELGAKLFTLDGRHGENSSFNCGRKWRRLFWSLGNAVKGIFRGNCGGNPITVKQAPMVE